MYYPQAPGAGSSQAGREPQVEYTGPEGQKEVLIAPHDVRGIEARPGIEEELHPVL